MDNGARLDQSTADPAVTVARRHRATAPRDAVGRLEWITQRLARALQRAVELVASDNDITVPEYHLLLATSDDLGRSNAEIARLMFVTPQSANRVLAGLERRGFVVRAGEASRGRTRNTVLTPAGRAVLEECTKRIEDIEARVMASLDDDQRNLILPALLRAAETLAGGYFGSVEDERRASENRRAAQADLE
ncbi:MarR family winged helix-turn-helix transcriptional regulator [Parafrigoribacterium soli]|uniref:MarR family winged helix-turn-helix transcriptional regulator n=1 Tax=Parafrigoribacterium soli TaxID=3144663 RepID=UPI0032EF7B23